MKKRVFALQKSSREKKRYFHVESKGDATQDIKEMFVFLFGVLKAGESGLKTKIIGQKQIVQIDLDFEKELIFCLYYLQKTKRQDIKIINESGTLAGLGIKDAKNKQISTGKKK